MKNKSDILDAVAKLLEAPDVVVRVQREMIPSQEKEKSDKFVVGKRITIILVGTQS